MSDQDLDYAAIRRNIDKSLNQQKWMYRWILFGTNLFFYVVTMLIVWGIALSNTQLHDALFNNGGAGVAILLVPTVLWGFMILSHLGFLYSESSEGEKAIREKLIMRELGEEILRRGLTDERLSEKPKRGTSLEEAARVLLSDDGELVSGDEQRSLTSHVIKS